MRETNLTLLSLTEINEFDDQLKEVLVEVQAIIQNDIPKLTGQAKLEV
jgi:hypothetical protein